MAERLRLYGMRALVTQAGSGIGEAVARTLVKHGAKVLAVDGVNSGVEQTFKAVKGVEGLSFSLLDPGRMPALVETAIDKLGSIDILVNEFPLSVPVPINEPDEQMATLLENRAALVLSLCRAALPHMQKSPAGRMINVGFLRSLFSADAETAFRKSEQDLAAITRALAAETGEFGITATYVQPGAIMTPTSREVFRRDKALRDYCIASSAARRLGEPVDVAKIVLFLASDDAGFVSGSGISADGGRSANAS